MTADQIKEQVAQSFENGGLDLEATGDIIVEKTKNLVKLGIDTDADAICHVFKTGEKVIVFFVVGRSVLAGPDAYKWILEYQNYNSSAAIYNVAEIAAYASEQLPVAGECTMPFKNPKNSAWRSFKIKPDGSLKSYTEIRKRAFMLLK